MAITLRDEISAKNRADIEAQTAPDQMYQSLANQYDQTGKQIEQGYRRTISQTENNLLSKGLGRSSYGAQIVANLRNQEIEAQTQNQNNLTAAYQNWLASYRQQQEQLQFQKDSADRQIAMSYLSSIAANGGDASDDLLTRAGISRQDFNAMKYVAPVASGGGGGGGRSGGGGGSPRPAANPSTGSEGQDTTNKFLQALNGTTNATTNSSLQHAEYKDSPFYIEPYDAKPLIEDAKKRRESLGLK